MTSTSLKNLGVEELVDEFLSMALAQDEALLEEEYGKYNRLFDRMEDVKETLKNRDGDERRVLLPLLGHRNAQVRLKAAIALLAVKPDAARATLQQMSDANEYPQAARARGMLKALDEGRYVPS
jgi:hypothetical protein